MNQRIRYKQNPHQKIFHQDDDAKFLHLSGGYGSGKTFGLVQKAFKLMIRNRHLPGGLVCPSYSDFKRDVMETIDQVCMENKINYFYHKGEHWYKFPWSRGKLFIATAEKQIKGPNWAFALINELTLIPFDRYREIIARVRLKKAVKPQIASCGTPEGLLSGYYQFFIENPQMGAKVVYGSTLDNKENLSDDYIESLRSAYDDRMLKAYMEGEFINTLGGRFYYNYDQKLNVDNSVHEDANYPVLISMDFNVDHMAATVWQWQNDGSLCAVGELILKNNADTNKMALALKSSGYTPERTTIYPDPAGNARSTKGQPDVQILKNHGFYDIKVRSAAPLFRKRQLNVNNLFDKRKIKINMSMCPGLHRDLLLCTQDPETLEKEKSAPDLTHSSDGMDYLMDLVFPYSGTKPISSVFSVR